MKRKLFVAVGLLGLGVFGTAAIAALSVDQIEKKQRELHAQAAPRAPGAGPAMSHNEMMKMCQEMMGTSAPKASGATAPSSVDDAFWYRGTGGVPAP